MKLLLLIYTLLFYTFANAQHLKVTYNIKDFNTQIPDSFKSNPAYAYLIKRNENIKKHIDQVHFELKATSNESIFTYIDILDPPKDIGKSIKSGIIATGMNGIFYSNDKTDELSIKKNIGGQIFTILTKSNNRIWHLENDRKFILNKHCLKATTTDTIRNSKGKFLKKLRLGMIQACLIILDQELTEVFLG